MLSTPSRTMVPVFSSILTLLVSGTCLIGMTIFNCRSPPLNVIDAVRMTAHNNKSISGAGRNACVVRIRTETP